MKFFPVTLFMLQALLLSAQSADSTVVDTIKTISLREAMVVQSLRPSSKTMAASTQIKNEVLNKANFGQDMPVLLESTPSVVSTSDAGAGVGYTSMRIRGSDQTRINVTINGVPINDAESQNVYWVDVPDLAASAEDIVVQRGAGSSTNGSGAFGGSVNVQTTQSPEQASGELNFSGGSFNTWRTSVKGGSGLLRNHYFIDGRFSFISSDGYIDLATSRMWSYFAQAGYKDQRTLFKLLAFGGREKTFQAWYGVPQDSLTTNRTLNFAGTDYWSHLPNYPNQVDNYAQHYFQAVFNRELLYGLNLNLVGFSTLGKGYYEEWKTDQKLSKYGIAPAFNGTDSVFSSDLVRRRWLDNVYYGGTLSLQYNRSHLNIILGSMVSRYSGRHFGNVIWARHATPDASYHYYASKSGKQDHNVFAKASYTLFRVLTLFVDLQYRYVKHALAGSDNSAQLFDKNLQWHFVNPKGGLALNLVKGNSRNRLYVTYAKAQREPTRDDIIDAPAGITPSAEQLHDVEAGYEFRSKNYAATVNGFYMHYKDQLVLTGKLNDVGNAIRSNVPQSFRTGVEVTGEVIFRAGNPNELGERRKVFAIGVQLTYCLSRIKNFEEVIYTYDADYVPVDSLTIHQQYASTDISFSPRWIASLQFSAYPIEDLEFSLTNKYVSKQYLDNTSNSARMLKGYLNASLYAAYTVRFADDRSLKFHVLVNNLYHRLYENNGYTYTERYTYFDDNNQLQTTDTYTYNYYYPQAGIHALGGITLRF